MPTIHQSPSAAAFSRVDERALGPRSIRREIARSRIPRGTG